MYSLADIDGWKENWIKLRKEGRNPLESILESKYLYPSLSEAFVMPKETTELSAKKERSPTKRFLCNPYWKSEKRFLSKRCLETFLYNSIKLWG